jgi:hypothetical protein
VILAVTVSSLPDIPFGTVEKRKADIPQIHRRQFGDCNSQCASIEAALACTTADCACPIFNSAGSAAVSDCASCVQTVQPLIASNITLFGGVCSKCQNQCSTSLTAYIQSLACNSTSCSCSLFSSVGLPTLTTCANCVQTFDPAVATGILQFAEQCGLGPTASASASAASSTSAQVATASTSAASSASTTSKSAGTRICADGFNKLFWIITLLGALCVYVS